MLLKEKPIITTTILMLLFVSGIQVFANYNSSQDSELDIAIEIFNSGNYEKASSAFKKLVDNSPDNPLLNYYYGACLAEQNIFTENTREHLLKAVSGDTPDKIFYYVGSYFQNKELWNSALKYFNRYKNYGTPEEKEKLKIQNLIDFCYNKANPEKKNTIIENTDTETKKIENFPKVEIENNIDTLTTETIEIESKNEEEINKTSLNTMDSCIGIDDNKELITLIRFQVNSSIVYLMLDHFKNTEALSLFNEGIVLEKKLGNILLESDSLREVFSKSTNEKTKISEKIISLEQESLTLKNQFDQLFYKAREIEKTYWANASEVEIAKFNKEVARLKQQMDQKKVEKNITEESELTESEAIIFYPEKEAEIENKQEIDKIIYKIQVGAYSRGVPKYIDRLFRKLSMIRKIDNYTDDHGVTVYTTGQLTNFEDALQMQAQVRQEGVKDAFIVAYKNEVRITLKEAKKLTE